MFTVAVVNSKGGVGKSTLSVHLVAWLRARGFRVALVDSDKQRSSSIWLAEAALGATILTADTPEDALKTSQEAAGAHDVLVADGPAGLDEISRSWLLLADLAILPVTPSILDLRSVSEATAKLRFAQAINKGRPEGRLVLNRLKTRDTISAEVRQAAPQLGIAVVQHVVRDLQAFRDAAQQGTVVSNLGRRGEQAASDIDAVCMELLGDLVARTDLKLTAQGG